MMDDDPIQYDCLEVSRLGIFGKTSETKESS